MNESIIIELKEAAQKVFRGISPEERKALIKGLDTSRNYIDQIVTGAKIVSAKRAMKIQEILGKENLAKELRPDIFGE